MAVRVGQGRDHTGNLGAPCFPFQQPISLQELIQDTKYSIKHARTKGYETNSMQHENAQGPGYWLEEILVSLDVRLG